MSKITIEFINHNEQKYNTCGDWRRDKQGDLQIKISKLGDARADTLVAIHELVEVLLCEIKGVSCAAVDRFDIEFDNSDESIGEPGDQPDAPYRDEHCMATAVERMLCAYIGLAWMDYDALIDRATENYNPKKKGIDAIK